MRTIRMIQELDVLQKNIQDLQKQLMQAYTRIGELTNEIHENTRTKTDEQLDHENKIFNNHIHSKDQS